ncbi:MAG: thiolase family protein, partial [Candidatus Zixiibacteriota bacterium]
NDNSQPLVPNQGRLPASSALSILDFMKKILLAGAARTPIGKFGGALKGLSAADLGVISAQASLERAGVSAGRIDETFFGCGRQAGGGPNLARQIGYRVGAPESAPATTINMACASSLDTIIQASRAITVGDIGLALTGGTESMSNVPHYILGARWGIPLGRSKLIDAMYYDGFHCRLCDMLMGATADNVAELKSISRAAQDEYALNSQQRAEAAQKDGRFTEEIVPVTIKTRKGEVVISEDEHPRHGATLEKLAKLPPVFSSEGTVTAGNACGIVDGAASLLVGSQERLSSPGATAQAEILGYAQSGVAPDVMGLGPVPAVRALLKAQKMTLADIDLIELNEAFAGQVLACHDELDFDLDKINVNGGAIALGHPIGATGARIVVTLISALKQRKKEIGLATLCVSGGQGTALLIRRI